MQNAYTTIDLFVNHNYVNLLHLIDTCYAFLQHFQNVGNTNFGTNVMLMHCKKTSRRF